jgi:TatD DNase family protein
MDLTDTHCHIHEAWKSVNTPDTTAKLWAKAENSDPDAIIKNAVDAGVSRMICVGTTLADSELAIDFVKNREHVWASIGIHPHEAKDYLAGSKELKQFASLANKPKVVAVGECGLDYYYNHSAKSDQERVLRFQIELALEHNLPMIFHVRDAFDDFWPIFDEYSGIRGVIHSFSSGTEDLEQILSRGLYVGLNGIMTFTKHVKQLDAAKAVPLNSLLLETDGPYLTPNPYRGSICEPRHVQETAKFLAKLRDETLDELALASSKNAHALFNF